MKRPNWDDYFMYIARDVATRATCPKRSVGVVIASREHRIIGTGYNGSPPGTPHCTDEGVGCLERDGHCIRAVHAEENALLYVGEREKLVGATIYVRGASPCYRCAGAILAVGIGRVVCVDSYDDPEAEELLRSQGRRIVWW